VIERDWYELGEWRLDAEGHCTDCATRIPGVFAVTPGGWGSRRVPVRLAAIAAS
jgi:pyruvate formate lyase activating enzyme